MVDPFEKRIFRSFNVFIVKMNLSKIRITFLYISIYWYMTNNQLNIKKIEIEKVIT